MLRILFCGFKYEYGRPELGLSAIEYRAFYKTLEAMEGVEAEFFAIDELMRQAGRDEMNRQLIRKVQEEKPDLLFCFLFTEELKKETIAYITRKTGTKTFNWFADDHWRLPVFSRFWAPLFTMAGTTDSQALAKYESYGITNVIKTQWAANTALCKPVDDLKIERLKDSKIEDCEIAFVGKKYGNRGSYIAYLKSHNLPAEGYGKGWETGVVSFREMLEIFSQSKINLNFTESYLSWPKEIVKLFIKEELGKYSLNFQFPISNLQSLAGKRRRQIKARIFEVPACGGFLLTGDADNLRDYYEDGKEIVLFKDKNDLVEKCRYYLEHEGERQAIALAGYQRTIKDHTYEQRFREIFKVMELV
ncbi:MAG: glycosyltransferase [Patescibacteria group bacterium]|nr:glycosyltransferase [Patescibacteria group bacterium]